MQQSEDEQHLTNLKKTFEQMCHTGITSVCQLLYFLFYCPSSASLYWCPSSPNSLITDDEFTTMMPRQEIPLLKYYILVLIHKVRGPSNHPFRLGLHAIKSLLALEASEVRTYAYTL